jgi:hypothetical protein
VNGRGRWARCCAAVAACLAMLAAVSACSVTAATEVPRCGSIERVALIAQSVPSSAYIPCISAPQPGWTSADLKVRNGHTRFTLRSDRSPDHPVEVELAAACAVGAATPITPRTPGGRTYLHLGGIDPRYTGSMYDVFPGGCVRYQFDFQRGPHIALMAQLASMVGFVSRQQLRLDVQRRLGVRLDP